MTRSPKLKNEGRHKVTQRQVQVLQKTPKDKERFVNKQIEKIVDLESQLKKVRSDYKKATENLMQAQRDISTLQQTLKEKASSIDKLKTAELKLNGHLSTTEKRAKELEEGNLSLE